MPPSRSPTDEEKRINIYYMFREGIKTVMTNHSYSWNGDGRLQNKGRGIGDKLADEVARLYLVSFDRWFVNIIHNASLHLYLYKRYVDDGNIKGKMVAKGYTWDRTTKSLVLTMNQK